MRHLVHVSYDLYDLRQPCSPSGNRRTRKRVTKHFLKGIKRTPNVPSGPRRGPRWLDRNKPASSTGEDGDDGGRLDGDQAFGALRHASQNRTVKVRVLALEVIGTGTLNELDTGQ